MVKWNGDERRKNAVGMTQNDRDMLIRMNQNLDNLIRNTDAHIESDTKQFAEIKKNQDFTFKMIFMAVGGFAVLTEIFRWVVK